MKELEENEQWHNRNLDYIRRAIKHAESKQPLEVETMLMAYAREEQARLGERARIMIRLKIDRYPHSNREESLALFKTLTNIIDRNRGVIPTVLS